MARTLVGQGTVFTTAGTPEPGVPHAHRTYGAMADRRANDVIGGWVERRPDAVALRMVDPAGTDSFTYRQLWDRVSRTRDGAFADLPAGSRVVLAKAGDVDYVAGFLAALEAGLIAVPLYPPVAGASERFLRRARHILQDCEPSAIYTDTESVDALQHDLRPNGPAVRGPDSTIDAAQCRSADVMVDGQVAFLQYSSGSTGQPKGIVNTHASMLRQLGIAATLWNSTADIHTVSWLPLYHDLGIFWGVLLALATGGTATVISPFDFVRNPRIWLDTVHRVRGNWIAGPDFAYRLCADAFDEPASGLLDLSCLRLATNGAEPIRSATLRDFAARFAPAGLRADAIAPQYGLAEAGLAVSGTRRPRPWVQAGFDAGQLNRGRAVKTGAPAGEDRRVQTLVSCGDTTFGWDVRIVDPQRRVAVPDGEVGEVWVGGTGLPGGYWRRPEQTAETFGATTADGAGPYLRTGDAGFRSGGELYICGRYRDLIIVGGGNYFPNDIESTVEEAHCGVRNGGACAVQPDTAAAAGEWWLAVETDSAPEDLDDLSRALRRRVLAVHQIAPGRIAWVRPHVLPRTTSGKIRRRATLALLGGGELDVVREVVARPELPGAGTELAHCVAGLLGVAVPGLGIDTDLTGLGLTSMMTAQVVEWAAARSQRLDFAELYAQPTLRHWQRLLDAAPPGAAVRTGTTMPDTFALTALQRAYWIGRDAQQPLGGVGCQAYVELGGAGIDPDRLATALDALAQRHPMLRSMFPDAHRYRIAAHTIHAPLRVHDLAETADGATGEHLDEVRTRLRTLRFGIETGDTWRVELTRLPDRCILHVAIDLIIADVTSIGILLHDLAALYRGDQLPALPGPFDDLTPRAAPPTKTTERLPECPQLPRVDEDAIVFRREQRVLGTETVTALDEACRVHRVTRAAVFLAAYVLVLRRWSGAESFAVNVTASGRPPGLPAVVGDFTRTHLCCADVDESAGFAGLTGDVQQGLRAALRAPETTELLAAQLLAGTGHSGIAPVVFTYTADAAVLSQRDADTLGSVGQLSSTTPQVIVDNQVGAVSDASGELIVAWDYRASCFPPGVVEDMFTAYAGLLEGLATHDWATPAVIDLPEHSRLTRRRRNATGAPRPAGLLYDRFRERAQADPAAVALRWPPDEFDGGPHGDPVALAGAQLTYGQLDDRARRVAAALADRHPPGSIIGIQLPKGPAQVVAVLGVLMAGCSYLPVGADQPADRCARICALSAMSGLIRAECAHHTATPAGPVVHHIESMLRHPAAEPTRTDPRDTAYLIYTSGSTGEPKGVLVSHAGALNTIVDVNRRNRVDSTDTLLAVSVLDFDLSVYDIFGPLSAGATVLTISERSRRDAFRWTAMIAEYGVTVWNSVPALLDMLLIATGDTEAAVGTLRTVLLSGDWIPLDMPRRLHRAAPAARLAAMGGATEAAIWSNEFVLPATGDVDPDWASVPYGYPLSNQMFRVVDELGRDRPDYVAGELWIGGAGVAQGYHRAPELTAERFHTDDTGHRWYRTGDLGCYWRDGTLQFLGRLDSQVKIGGHRVECGEVEQALRGHQRVEAAAVVPLRRGMALGAIVVCGHGGAAFTDSAAAELPAYLATRLPQYMIPKLFIARTELPLTANGKIDRRRVAAELESAARTRAPDGLSPVERVVADVWSDVLDTPITSRDDNFFSHGGDSLHATRVAAELKRRGVLGAAVGELLGRQTLGEFSSVCVVAAPGDEPAEQPADPAGGATEFPLTRLQQAYVLGSAGLSGTTRAPTYFSIVLAADTPGADIDVDRFAAAVTGCVGEFTMLRCALAADTGQRVHDDVTPVAVTIVAGTDPGTLLRQMADAAFDPRAIPAIRCFALAESTRYVGLLVNYLSLDARSLAVVIATILADYQRLPRPRQVDPGAAVFARFTAETRGDHGSAGHPVGPPPVLPVSGRPIDPAARVGFTRSGFTLDPQALGGLRDHAARLRATPAALIFEAFTDALHSLGAGDRFAVVVPVSHRPDYAPAEVEVLGNFTRLALCSADYRVAPPGSPEAAAAAQDQLWRAVGSGGDATGRLAAARSAGSAGYPVVFTSTLGLIPPGASGLASIRTLTQTPGVWLDCQVEDDAGGARISWDIAAGIIADAPLAAAFAHFQRAVRRYAGCLDAVEKPAPLPADPGWAGAVITAAAGLCAGRQIRPEYTALVRHWRGFAPPGHTGAARHDTGRAARRLADIVTGAASPQTLVGDPQLAPEAMLLTQERLHRALDDLTERIFGHARSLGRRLTVLEVGSRTGLTTRRLTGMAGAVIEEYLCFEPNPVLAQIAAERPAAAATRRITSTEQLAVTPADVVICCGSLHQLGNAAAVLDALTVTDGGWLWLAEICELTPATLAGAAVLNPELLAPGVRTFLAPERWWQFVAEYRWHPVQMTRDGPGLTIIARRSPGIAAPRTAPPAGIAAPPPATARPDFADASVLATIADIWRRHLDTAAATPLSAADDFFLLGGDSLIATRVYADLQAAGFAQLDLVDLFNYPVLGQLAAHAGTPGGSPPAAVEPTPARAGGATEFPLTVVQRAYLAGRAGGFPLSGVAAHCYVEFETGDFDRSRFENAARRLVERHPGLRTTVTAARSGAQPALRGVVHPAPIEPVVSDHADVRARMRDQVIDLTTRPGIDFGVQTPDTSGDGRVIVGVSMDNAMLDGASMMIALAQLDYLYRGGSADELPALRTSFADYVRTHPELCPEADEAALPRLATSRDYWRARLPSLPPAPQPAPTQAILDIDRPVFERAEAAVGQSDWARITRVCRTEGITPTSFLLAGYARTLADWAQMTHFCLNVTLFDRDPTVAGIEDVIGDFTSLLLVECRIDPTVSIWEQARRLQRQLISDLPHRAADAVWLQRELLHHHGRPAQAVFPVVFTSGLGLIDTAGESSFQIGALTFGCSQTPQTVLDFQMWEKAGTLALSWDFVTQAIPPDVARRHLGAMVEAILAAVPAGPAAPDDPWAGDQFVEQVLRICADALGIPRVRPGDNFFQLGGDSVTATKVVERTGREVSANATLRLLFENPVIGQFAEALRTASAPADAGIEEGVL